MLDLMLFVVLIVDVKIDGNIMSTKNQHEKDVKFWEDALVKYENNGPTFS